MRKCPVCSEIFPKGSLPTHLMEHAEESDEDMLPLVPQPPHRSSLKRQPVTPTTPGASSVMSDVTAYVEIGPASSDASKAVGAEMKKMGAKIAKRFSTDVTHVVFKEGKCATYDKAMARGLHLVSVLWVDGCKQSGVRVNEKDFAAKPDYKVPTPRACTCGQADYQFLFPVTLTLSTSFILNSDVIIQGQKSGSAKKNSRVTPVRTGSGSAIKPGSAPSRLTSVINPLDSLDRRINTAGDKMFQIAKDSDISETKMIRDGRNKQLHFSSDESEEEDGNQSDISEELHPTAALKTKVTRKTTSLTKTIATKDPKKTTKSELKRRGETEETATAKKKRLAALQFGTETSQLLGAVATRKATVNRRHTTLPTITTIDSAKGTPCKTASNHESTTELLHPIITPPTGRMSSRIRRKSAENNNTSTHTNNVVNECLVNDEYPSPHTATNTPCHNDTQALGGLSLSTKSKAKSPNKEIIGVIVTTNLHTADRDVVHQSIAHLGGYRLDNTVTEETTHVVCGNQRRTLNVLGAIANGCWLVSKEWVLNSLSDNKWVSEEPFEMFEWFPAARLERLHRMLTQADSNEVYSNTLFQGVIVLIGNGTNPSRDQLEPLINMCGGKVTTAIISATVCVCPEKECTTDMPVVSEKWIL
eukprot:Ihof_evm8s100 gene=Ihof_evmTU8s100